MTTTTPTITSFTTYDVTATLTPDGHHPGWYETEVVLSIDLGQGARQRHRRVGLGFVGAEGSSPRGYAGPDRPGPWAFAFPVPLDAMAFQSAALLRCGLYVEAVLGDRLVFQGSTYVIERDGHDQITLIPVA